MLKGLFLNPPRANCSISESGMMIYDALRTSRRYKLDYLEIDGSKGIPLHGYDFYAFNYHHARMSWLDMQTVRALPGFKATFVLEVQSGDPFVLCPREGFDAYCALDPTLKHRDRRVYAFPRPLEPAPSEQGPSKHAIPVIGSFGFATPGKGFELVAAAVNREFDRAILRINIPPGDFADPHFWVLQRRDYADYLGQLVRGVAKPGIEVQLSRDYLSKSQLIDWCADNTLNCFLYSRTQPGLSATTDQAVSSGRPLAVSANETFRHIHEYVTPYPYRSLRESIEKSVPEVAQMRSDWAPAAFSKRFEQVLEDAQLLARKTERVQSAPVKKQRRLPILVVSHTANQCGINQYGKNIAAALRRSRKYEVKLAECSDEADLIAAIACLRPIAIIYNYYPTTMPWLNRGVTERIPLPQFGVMHEVTQEEADAATRDMFDFHLCPDPTIIERNSAIIRTSRLVPVYQNYSALPEIPTIGSFGFGMADKGFERLIDRVQEEFDEARIRIQMPFNDVVDPGGRYHALSTAESCRQRVRKPGIRLEISYDFTTPAELHDFLASNTLNAFFYDERKHRGISSTIDHALAVQRPIAITRCGMFRHILGASPSVCIDDMSLKQLISNGVAPLVPFYNAWSEDRFVAEYDGLLDRVLRECWANGGRLANTPKSGVQPVRSEGAANMEESTDRQQQTVDPTEMRVRLREWLAALGYSRPPKYELAGSLPTRDKLGYQLEANVGKLRSLNHPRTEVPVSLRRLIMFRLPIVGPMARRLLLKFLWLLFADQRRFNQALVDAIEEQNQICLSLAETVDQLEETLARIEDKTDDLEAARHGRRVSA